MLIFNLKTTLILFIFILLSADSVCPQRTPDTNIPLSPDDCSWQSPSGTPTRAGSRKALKLRTVEDGKNYTKYNRGKPINIDEWFKFTCGLDALIPKEIPKDKPIEGAENIRVTLRGYLLGAKFMREGDHDLHVELAATSDWNTDHIVIEMSPGTEYCAARKALWNLIKKDGCLEDQCIMQKPVKVLVTGYVLIGNPQPGVTEYCQVISNRGLKKGEQQGRIRGLWRLQPILSLKKG